MTRMYSVDPHKRSAVVHFDWLTAVLPIPDEQERQGQTIKWWVNHLLYQLNVTYTFEPMKHGLYTYDTAASAAGASIIIAYSNDPDKNDNTLMIQMSGTGVESLESVLDDQGAVVADFIKQVLALDGTFSRVDACCNFFNYPVQYSARYAGEEAEAGHLVTRSSRVRMVRAFPSSGGRNDEQAYQGVSEGYTTYVGINPKQLRIYNKLAERSDKLNQRYAVDSWSRWEFQLNGKHAQAFIDAFVERDCDLVQTWTDWLKSNYRWIETVNSKPQKHRFRYPNAQWFQDIIQNAHDEIKVRSEKQKPTLERSEQWVKTQVMPSLGNIYYARYLKYIKNGVSSQDASKLAFKYIRRDIEAAVVNDDINRSMVDGWLKEQGYDYDWEEQQ